MTKVILLGTNGWYDSPTGRTVCALVMEPGFSLVLDAGFGFAGLDAYIDADLPVYLFLSHFHLDHTVGLHTLAKYRFNAGLKIFGQPGTRHNLFSLLGSPFSIPPDQFAYPIEIHELPEGQDTLPFRVSALPLVHADPCLGFRFELPGGKVLTYCTDTGYTENAVRLARGADLLVTECSLLPGVTDDGWPHLNPELAARIAFEAGARRLVLTHFDARSYRTPADRQAAAEAARRIFPQTQAGQDGLAIDL